MTLQGDAKFKGKLTRDLKNDIRNLVNFHGNTLKPERLNLMDSFCLKYIIYQLENFGGIMCHGTEG